MILENKLGIKNAAELAREEERISKKKQSNFLKMVHLINWNVANFHRLN